MPDDSAWQSLPENAPRFGFCRVRLVPPCLCEVVVVVLSTPKCVQCAYVMGSMFYFTSKLSCEHYFAITATQQRGQGSRTVMGKAGSSSVPRLLSSSAGSSKLTKAEKRRLNTRYSRGEGNTPKGVTKPVLKRSIKRQEAKISAAERQAAQAEVLQPTEAGYLEAEGPLERTARVRQSQLAAMVDVQTAQKAYDVQLDQLGPYRVAFTPNGRRVLLGGRKGHVAVAQWEGGFRVLSEIQASRHLSSVLRLLFCPAHPRPFSITTNGRASRCRPPPPPVARLVGSLSAISSCAALPSPPGIARSSTPGLARSSHLPPPVSQAPSGISTPPSGISGAGDGAGRLLPARPH